MIHSRDFILILLIGISIRIGLMILIPLYPENDPLPGYNDEPLHLNYVNQVSGGDWWPVWEASKDSLNYLTDSFVQPPLYYLLTSALYRTAGNLHKDFRLYGARFFSVLLGIMASLLVYLTVFIWSDDHNIAIASFIAMMLSPNSVIFTTLVTNDALAICLSAIVFYLVMGRRAGLKVNYYILGVAFGAVVWTKMSGLALLPLIWYVASSDLNDREKWIARGKVAAVALIIIAPLLIWNIYHYGEPIPGQMSPLASEYWPEEASGIEGGAIFHPIIATKNFLRLMVVPFDALWGGKEKAVSVIWILIYGSLFVYGLFLTLRKQPNGNWFIVGIGLVLAGFIFHNIKLFQVEFRLFAVAYPAMALVMGRSIAQLKLPIMVQMMLWGIPLSMIVVLAL